MSWTLNLHYSSNFDAFFPVRINKMWNFWLKLWFFMNPLLQRWKTCGIGFSMPQTLNTHHSSHFDAFSQSKSTKCEILAVSLAPPDKKTEKNVKLHREKVFTKACKSAHIGFWVCQSQRTMLEHCVTYFFSYYGFSAFFIGRSRYWVLQHGVGVKWGPRRTAAYVPSHFHGFEPHFLLCVS